MEPKIKTTEPCGNCGAEKLPFLHHVHDRGIFRRLCTSCVLRLHPQSFCPTCFQVHPHPPPTPEDDAVLTCTKCYSSSHRRCLSSSSSSSSPYVCPLCTHPPGTPLFKLKSADEANLGGNFRVMDKDAARRLLAAAKIARSSINAANICARAEAEKRAREAVYARKRANAALEYFAYVAAGKMRRKDSKSGRSQVSVVKGRRDNLVIRGGDGLLREVSNVADNDGNGTNDIVNYDGDTDAMNGDGNGEVVDVDIGECVRVNDSMNTDIVTSVDEVRSGGETK